MAKNSNDYNRKLRKPTYIRFMSSVDLWSHFYGLASFLGLTITIIVLVYSYNNKSDDVDFNFVLISLITLLVAVLVIFFMSVVHFNKKLKQMGQIPSDYNFYRNEYEKQEIIVNQLSECSHIVSHYFRNIDFSLQEIIDLTPKDVSEEKIINVVNKFEYFLINISTNLQSYFSQITDDNCSITIKLLNLNEIKSDNAEVKTYFRDPVNFKKRREADNESNGGCSIIENSAFSLIMNPNLQNIYFAEDDLVDLYERHKYKNPNPDWHKYYTSSLVVPISIVTGRNERNILGFLSVDNFKGGLAVNSNKEYLFFVADILYLAFSKYHKVINIAQSKNIQNEKIDRFTNWN